MVINLFIGSQSLYEDIQLDLLVAVCTVYKCTAINLTIYGWSTNSLAVVDYRVHKQENNFVIYDIVQHESIMKYTNHLVLVCMMYVQEHW